MSRKKPRKDDNMKPLEHYWGRNMGKKGEGSGTAKIGAKSNIETRSKARRDQNDAGNTMAEGAQCYQMECEPGNEKLSEDKYIEFRFHCLTVDGAHVVKGKADNTIYSALMAMDVVKDLKEKHPKKELHLVDKQGKTGFVNLGMPLKCLEEKTIFDMLFYPFGQKCTEDGNDIMERYRKYEGAANEFVIFYVRAKAKQIILSNALRTSRYSLCVFAPKGESLQDAIYNDGRFWLTLKKTPWQMVEDGKNIHSPVNAVDDYAKKTLEVEFVKQKVKKTSAEANQTLEHSNLLVEKILQCFDKSLLEQYPGLIEQGELIEELLRVEAKKLGKLPRSLLQLEMVEFGKKAFNSTTVRLQKTLLGHSRSVGYIEWDNNGIRGSATCFLLADPYILTCHHVVRRIVGEGVEETQWANIIRKSTKVTFIYEDMHINKEGWYSIDPWFEVFEKNLDYALLRLKENPDHQLPSGLMKFVDTLPHNGLVHIIGHPDNEEKTVDPCMVMPFLHRHPEIRCRLNEEQQGHDCNISNCGTQDNGRQCIHMYSQSSFPGIQSLKVLTYDTSFYHGSSGSPVFDSYGHLVALHAAGFGYHIQRKLQSVIEFGYSMTVILSDIEKKKKCLYDSLKEMERTNDEEDMEDEMNSDEERNEEDMSDEETTGDDSSRDSMESSN